MSFQSYFPRNFSSFCDLKFFPGFSLFFPFESYSFQEFLKFSGLKVVLVALLASGKLGLAGSLACRGLCCLCCLCSHSLAGCHLFESYFSWIFSSFSVLEILSRIFFGVLI